jgi:ADP-ribosyl-[dinitrogen reductase] hydrolase
MTSTEIRAIGCLLGQAIGDALGARYEFGKSKNATYLISKDMVNNHLPLLGEGPHDLLPGQITDDTELALGLARALVSKGQFKIATIAQAYSHWFHSQPFDCGMTTSKAMINTVKGQSEEYNFETMKNDSAKTNEESLSNGFLMRVSPLAIAGLHWTHQTLIQAAKFDCQLTNPHLVAQDTVSVYVIILQTLMLTGDRNQAYTTAIRYAETQTVIDLLTCAIKAPEPININGKSTMTQGPNMGYFGIALQNAVWELMTTTSFESSLINIISKGGDTDTNACIAGAMLGAYYGHQGIPTDWIQTVTSVQPQQRLIQYPTGRTSDLIDLAIALSRTVQEPTFV